MALPEGAGTAAAMLVVVQAGTTVVMNAIGIGTVIVTATGGIDLSRLTHRPIK